MFINSMIRAGHSAVFQAVGQVAPDAWHFRLNLLAVISAAVVSFAIGALWYSPMLFAKPWMAAHGYTPESMAAMRSKMAFSYSISFICMILMAMVMSILMGRIGVVGGVHGARFGAFTWLGFAATTGLTANVYSNKPMSLYFIDAGYQLVYMAVMGAILAVWL